MVYDEERSTGLSAVGSSSSVPATPHCLLLLAMLHAYVSHRLLLLIAMLRAYVSHCLILLVAMLLAYVRVLLSVLPCICLHSPRKEEEN